MQWRIACIAWICLCLGLSLALPQNIIGGGIYGDVKVTSGSCSQSITWFGRATGLNGTEHSAQDTMICGLVTDSVWCGTTMDALYFFPTNNATNAKLNMCSTSFSLNQTGSPTFTADHGFTGDASAAFFDTQFNPSTAGGNFTQNANHVAAYVLTSRTTSNLYEAVGNSDKVSSVVQILPLSGGQIFINNSDVCGAQTNSNAQGFWIAVRVDSTHVTWYQNDAVFLGPAAACTSATLQSLDLYILARNGAGTADDFSGDQLAAVTIGGTLTSTQEHRIACRINQAMTTMGINVYANSGC